MKSLLLHSNVQTTQSKLLENLRRHSNPTLAISATYCLLFSTSSKKKNSLLAVSSFSYQEMLPTLRKLDSSLQNNTKLITLVCSVLDQQTLQNPCKSLV